MDEAASVGPPAVKGVTSALFAVAAVAGMTDFIYFLRVPAPVARKPKPDLRLMDLLREPLADASFRRYLAFIATLTFGTGYTGQFIWLLLFDVAHMTNTQAGFLVIVIPILVTMFCARVWGRVVDRVGRKPVLILCGCLVCHGGATWMFVQGPLWWIGYGGVILASMAWPGLELAGFNLLLSMGDPRSGRRHGSAYPAVHSLVVALSGMVSGIFGGWLAHRVGDWQSTLFGYPLTYHGVVLLSSVGIRALALVWLPGIQEPKAAGTRAALLHVGVSAMDHMRDAVSVPVRLLMRAGQWTYRLTPGKGRGGR
jgi:MFS family permease